MIQLIEIIIAIRKLFEDPAELYRRQLVCYNSNHRLR
jgi:hypothetical protein